MSADSSTTAPSALPPVRAAELLPDVYTELKRLAARALADESPAHTLQPTALVHEAYLRLAGGADTPRWRDRSHFLFAAAASMRRVLVDHARRRKRLRRGGDRQRVALDDDQLIERREDELLGVDEWLDALTEHHPNAGALVNLHVFAGLPLAEAAAELGVSERTAYRLWDYARAWVFERLYPA